MKRNLGFALALALSFLAIASSSADPKDPPGDPDCSQYDSGGCIYTWYPDASCCIAPPIDIPPYQIQCPTVCF